jgi:hypothetical protein
MSSLVISGDTSGTITVAAPAVSGTNTITLPAVTGTAVVSGQNSAITAGTAVASTSGTSIDFTSIPSWIKRVTVLFNGVSTNGTSIVQIQLGSSTFSTSGYSSTASFGGSAAQYTFASTGFIIDATNDALANIGRSGFYQFNLITSNTWVGSGNLGTGSTGQVTNACGGNSPNLSGALDRVRITTVNGTDAFDAGTINILYE